MIPTKTKVSVLINKYSTDLNKFISIYKRELDDNSYVEFCNLLKSDFGFLLHHFYSGYSNIEYEKLFITCINDLIDSVDSDQNNIQRNNIQHSLRFWNDWDSNRKDIYISITEKLMIPKNNIESISFLSKKMESKYIDLLKEWILKVSDDLISIDNFVDSSEKTKYEGLLNMLENSEKDFGLEELKNYINKKLKSFSLNNNDTIVENPVGFRDLVVKNQKKIVSADKKYVQDFLKIDLFLNTKYDQVLKSLLYINEEEKVFNNIDKLTELLSEQVKSYNLVYYYSLNMVIALLNENYFIFYEIHQQFDEFGVFNNRFEKDLIGTLKNIDDELKDLNLNLVKKLSIIEGQLNKVVDGVNMINTNLIEIVAGLTSMEESISSGFNNLNRSLESNFSDLNNNLISGFEKLNSSVDAGNLVSVVQTYQLYKINKQTKGLSN